MDILIEELEIMPEVRKDCAMGGCTNDAIKSANGFEICHGHKCYIAAKSIDRSLDHHTDSADSYDRMPIEKNPTRLDDIPDTQPYTPKVGEECEFRFKRNIDDPDNEEWSQWFSGEIDYKGEAKMLITTSHEAEGAFWNELLEFRPLKTEREQLFDRAWNAIIEGDKSLLDTCEWNEVVNRTINLLLDSKVIK